MNIAKKDVVEASGSLQLHTGQKSGSKAAIHETDGVLLIDASNAFNALNRQAALHNIRVQCPIIATLGLSTGFEVAGNNLKVAGE